MDDATTLADLRRQTRTSICGSQTLAGLVPFRDMLAAGAFDAVMLDLVWCGGLTQGHKMAALANPTPSRRRRATASGPVALWAGLNLPIHAPTAIYQASSSSSRHSGSPPSAADLFHRRTA